MEAILPSNSIIFWFNLANDKWIQSFHFSTCTLESSFHFTIFLSFVNFHLFREKYEQQQQQQQKSGNNKAGNVVRGKEDTLDIESKMASERI